MLGVNETYRHNDSRLKFDRSLRFELFKLTPSFDCEMVDLDCEMVVETWRGGLGFSPEVSSCSFQKPIVTILDYFFPK